MQTSPSAAAGYRFAKAAPVKAARMLRKIEATLATGVHAGTSEETRLQAQVDGLRAGLGDGVRCRICGRALDNEDSKKRGIGSTCWEKGWR